MNAQNFTSSIANEKLNQCIELEKNFPMTQVLNGYLYAKVIKL